ncbi:hypothetical protein D3C78_448390 [compost metagenome]
MNAPQPFQTMLLSSLVKVFADEVPNHEFYHSATALVGETFRLYLRYTSKEY